MRLLRKIYGRLKLEQNGLIQLIPLFIILGGIIAGVFLVLEGPRIFKPQAISESFEFYEFEGGCVKTQDDEQVLTCAGPVQFKLTSPLDSNVQSDSVKIVKEAFAQGVESKGGKGYFCDPAGEDDRLILRKECKAFFTFLCDWELFGAKWEDTAHYCARGLKCEDVSEGLFGRSARCVSKEDSTFIPSFRAPTVPRLQLPISPVQAHPTPAILTTPFPSVRITASPTPTSVRPRSTSAPTPTPPRPTSPGGAATPTVSPTASQTQVTTNYRFAENPASLKTAAWKIYTKGGVQETITFSHTQGDKFIYAEFKDNRGQIINARPFPKRIRLISQESPNPTGQITPTPRPTSAAGPSPTITPRPTSTPIVTPTVKPTSIPTVTPTIRPTFIPTPTPRPVATAKCTALFVSNDTPSEGSNIEATIRYTPGIPFGATPPTNVKIWAADNYNIGKTNPASVTSWSFRVGINSIWGGFDSVNMTTDSLAKGQHLLFAEIFYEGKVVDDWHSSNCVTSINIQ